MLFAVVAFFNPAAAVGPAAAAVNPAQLAYPERQGFAWQIVDVAAGFGNNSFSLSQYNRYNGAFLDDVAKQEILGSVPRCGVGASAAVGAAAATVGYGQFVLSNQLVGEAGACLPRDLVDLALSGNELGRTYSAGQLTGRTSAWVRSGMSMATGLGRNLRAGFGAHYLRGLFLAELTSADASLRTSPNAFISEGEMSYRVATSGSGWSVDVGLAYVRDRWRVSLGCLDLGPGIVWTGNCSEGTYAYEVDSANAWQLLRGSRFRYSAERDAGASFTTAVPATLNLGAAYCPLGWVSCGGLVSGRLGVEGEGWSAVGYGEAWPLGWLPVGASVGYRSGAGLVVGAGAGLVWRALAIRAEVGSEAGLLLGAKGVNGRLGLSIGGFYNPWSAARDDTLRIRYEGD
jgi:hypothetical protein